MNKLMIVSARLIDTGRILLGGWKAEGYAEYQRKLS